MQHTPAARVHITEDACEGLPALLKAFPIRAFLGAKGIVGLPSQLKQQAEAQLATLRAIGFSRATPMYFTGLLPKALAPQIHPFTGCSRELRNMAEGEILAPDLAICLSANSKGVLQRWLTSQGMRPFGEVISREELDMRMISSNGDGQNFIVKPDHSASGISIFRMNQPPTHIVGERFVVQEYIEHEFCLSLQAEIFPDRTWNTYEITQQLIKGFGHYGNVYPVNCSDALKRRIYQIAEMLLDYYASIGYWGWLSIDYLIDRHPSHDQATAYVNEVNARISAPWYARSGSLLRYKTVIPFHMQSYWIDSKTGYRDILRWLGDLAMTKEKNKGVVVFCYLPEHNYVTLVAYAKKIREMHRIAKEMQDRMPSRS